MRTMNRILGVLLLWPLVARADVTRNNARYTGTVTVNGVLSASSTANVGGAPTQSQGLASRLYLKASSASVNKFTMGNTSGGDGFTVLYDPSTGATAFGTNGGDPASATPPFWFGSGNRVAMGTNANGSDRLRVVGEPLRSSRADTTPVGAAASTTDDLILGSTDTANTGMTIFGTGFGIINFGDVASNNAGAIAYEHGNGFRIAVEGTGDVVTIKNDGFYLQTTGGTASALNYYEEFTHATNFTLGGTAAQSGSKDLKIIRTGKNVTICFPAITLTGTAGASASIESDTDLPVRFRPAGTYLLAGTRTLVANTTQADIGKLSIDTSGNISLEQNFANPPPNWGTSGGNGFQNAHCVSYHIN
jgi:hypothetical protein